MAAQCWRCSLCDYALNQCGVLDCEMCGEPNQESAAPSQSPAQSDGGTRSRQQQQPPWEDADDAPHPKERHIGDAYSHIHSPPLQMQLQSSGAQNAQRETPPKAYDFDFGKANTPEQESLSMANNPNKKAYQMDDKPSKDKPQPARQPSNDTDKKQSYYMDAKRQCKVCGSNAHHSRFCNKQDKKEAFAKQNKLCLFCLGDNHKRRECGRYKDYLQKRGYSSSDRGRGRGDYGGRGRGRGGQADKYKSQRGGGYGSRNKGKKGSQSPAQSDGGRVCSYCGHNVLRSKWLSHLAFHETENKKSKHDLQDLSNAIPCDICSASIPVQQYSEHLIRCQQLQPQQQPREQQESSPQYMQCEACGERVQRSEMASHKLAHELDELQQKPFQMFKKCPVCAAQIVSMEMSSHLLAHRVQSSEESHIQSMRDQNNADEQSNSTQLQLQAQPASPSNNNSSAFVTCDICKLSIKRSEMGSHKMAHQLQDDIEQMQKTEMATMIPCEVIGCNKDIAIAQWHEHCNWHKAQLQLERNNLVLHQQIAMMEEEKDAALDALQLKAKQAMLNNTTLRCKIIKNRSLQESSEDMHFRRCESQFMRSCTNMPPSSDGRNKTITEIEYVFNPKLMKKFQAKKQALMNKNGCNEQDLNVVLLWHGTASQNIDGIFENNFDIAKLGAHTGDKGWYGAGVYFSEFANVSQGYGDGLLLCKVILGRQFQMTANQRQDGRALQPGYDSHVVVSGQNALYGQEVVIFGVDQILPCYIVKY